MTYTKDGTTRANPIRIGLLAVIVSLSLTGCVIPLSRSVVNEVPLNHYMRVTCHFPVQKYRLAPGDVLEFLYITVPSVTNEPYRIAVLDRLDIEFGYHPELNRTVTVRPDGKISIPRKSDFKIAGMTVDSAKARLKKMYGDVLRDPEITLIVQEFNAKKEEIREAMSNGPCGEAREVRIAPDGSVSLPLISHSWAEGLTVPELTDRLNKRYRKLIGDVTVSVLLKEVNGDLVFVDGQVDKPGVYHMQGPRTVQQIIALAGGVTDEAELRTILVVSKAPNGLYASRTCDLTNVSSATDLRIQPGDLVYAPRSRIARADLWVEQNIRRLLLFGPWDLGLRACVGGISGE